MGTEIERKFLVTGAGWRDSVRSLLVRQGYICLEPGRTVRVRSVGGRGYITIKGARRGISRTEFEYPIPIADAEQMLRELCRPTLIEKIRHWVDVAGQTWEVDEFQGDNLGLVVAEVELQSEDQAVRLPDWVGREVSQDRRYTNSYLSQTPFRAWPQADRG